MIEFSVPLRDDSPTLALDAMEAPSFAPEVGGPMAVQVAAGTPVLFTPETGNATLVEVLGWAWTPADTTQPSDTGECPQGVNPCEQPVYEDGTMKITARVDGQMREATAEAATTPPFAALACEDATRGSFVRCTITVHGTATLDVVEWRFAGSGYSATTTANTPVWEGTAVIGGVVEADVLLDGQAQPSLETGLSVSQRDSGIWAPGHWSSQITFVQGQGSIACKQSTRAIPDVRIGWSGSLNEASSCLGHALEPTNGGYTLAEGSGPNAGVWYINDVSYFMRSTSQVHPDLLPTAPAYSLTDLQQATDCRSAMGLPPGSAVFVNFYDFNNICSGVRDGADSCRRCGIMSISISRKDRMSC